MFVTLSSLNEWDRVAFRRQLTNHNNNNINKIKES